MYSNICVDIHIQRKVLIGEYFGWLFTNINTSLYLSLPPPPCSLCSPNSIVLLGCGESIYFENSSLSFVSTDDTWRRKIRGTHFILLELWVKQYSWRKELKERQKLPSFLLAELVSSSAGFPCLWEALWGQLKPPGSLSELANDTYLSPCPRWAECCKATFYPPVTPIQPIWINLKEGGERVWHPHQNKLISGSAHGRNVTKRNRVILADSENTNTSKTQSWRIHSKVKTKRSARLSVGHGTDSWHSRNQEALVV